MARETEVTVIPRMRLVIYTTYAAFPVTGLKTGDLAYATDTYKLYRWNGAAWQEITSPSEYPTYVNINAAGGCVLPSWCWRTNVNQAIVLGTLYFVPFFVEQFGGYDRIMHNVKVASGVGGSLLRAGIYDNLDGYPNNLIVDGGTGLTDAAAAVQLVIWAELTRGLYFLATVSNQICSLQGIDDTTISKIPFYTKSTDLNVPAYPNVLALAGEVAQVVGGLDDPATAGATRVAATYAVGRLRG